VVPPQRLRRSSERGQAGLEYVGVVLLVAVVLGAVAMAADGSGIPHAVHRQMLRALCIARAGDCDEDRTWCPVATDRRRDIMAARILVFRVGQEKAIVREERSDGTTAITVAYGKEAGLELGDGGHVRLSLGHGGIGLGGELTAAAVASRERGYTWVLHDDRAIAALVGRLGASRSKLERLIATRRLPAPTLRYEHGGARVDGELSRGTVVGASLGLSSEDVSGRRINALTHRTTVYVQRTVDGSLSLTHAGSGATAAQTDRERYAITYDASGRPLDLMVMTTGTFRVSADLPNHLQPAVGLLSVPTGHGRVYVEETHLDLTEPENLRLASAFVEQVRHPDRLALGPAVAIATALRRRLDEEGIVHARTYDYDERNYGIDVSAAIEGVGLGTEVSRIHEDTRLVAATTRGLDGVWRRRGDCLARA
jgi:hypothetical protein